MLSLNRRGYFSPTKAITILSLLVPYIAYSSLSVTTAQTIRGNAPKLNTLLETEITNQSLSLLGIEISGTPYYGGSTIMINTPGITKLNEIHPIIKTLSTGDASDNDGDTNFSLSALTSLSLIINDASATNVPASNYNKTLCELNILGYQQPYTLTVLGDLKLSTQYGSPSEQQYTAMKGVGTQPQSPSFQLSASGICYVKPISLANYSGYDPDIWDPTYGFKPQSKTNPEQNFPTTGFNQATFYLNIFDANLTPSTTWNVTPSSIGTATVTSNDTVTVVLQGADYLSPSVFSPIQVKISNPSNTISYEFNIQNWYIARPTKIADFPTAKNYCDNLAIAGKYELPTRAQYSNSTLSSNNFIRAIGEGLLPEWGALYSSSGPIYPNSYWDGDTMGGTWWSYWASEQFNSTHRYDVSISSGLIGYNDESTNIFYAACVSN